MAHGPRHAQPSHPPENGSASWNLRRFLVGTVQLIPQIGGQELKHQTPAYHTAAYTPYTGIVSNEQRVPASHCAPAGVLPRLQEVRPKARRCAQQRREARERALVPDAERQNTPEQMAQRARAIPEEKTTMTAHQALLCPPTPQSARMRAGGHPGFVGAPGEPGSRGRAAPRQDAARQPGRQAFADHHAPPTPPGTCPCHPQSNTATAQGTRKQRTLSLQKNASPAAERTLHGLSMAVDRGLGARSG